MALHEETMQRAVKAAQLLLKDDKRIREIATTLGTSKATIHRDLTERLPRFNKKLADEVKWKLERNAEEGHVRGGAVIKQRYLVAQQ